MGSSFSAIRVNRIPERGKSARGTGEKITHESPTPDGVRLVHVFAPPGFMSESRGSRGTGGNSKASARFHGHKRTAH